MALCPVLFHVSHRKVKGTQQRTQQSASKAPVHLIKANSINKKSVLRKQNFSPGYPLYYRLQFNNNPPSSDLRNKPNRVNWSEMTELYSSAHRWPQEENFQCGLQIKVFFFAGGDGGQIFKFLFIYMKHRDTDRDLQFVGLPLQMPATAQAGPSKASSKPEARESIQVSHMGGRDPRT